MADEIRHYGILRKSGRYPWGSGENPYQRAQTMQGMYNQLKAEGLAEKDIAKALNMSTRELRSVKTVASDAERAYLIQQIRKYQNKNWSNVAIGEKLGIDESKVRRLMKPDALEQAAILENVQNALVSSLDEAVAKGAVGIDVGLGTENALGVSGTKLQAAIAALEDKGYQHHTIKTTSVDTKKETKTMVLAPKGTDFVTVAKNKDKIEMFAGSYSDDGGRTVTKVKPPKSLDPDRLEVRYGPEGGAERDGMIELRRGVREFDMGEARYAQVRIKVGKDRYLKGMAVLVDDLPDGVDVRFNTNKERTANKLDALKETETASTAVNEFGTIVRQYHYTDENGKKQQSVLNILGDKEGERMEGNWDTWSKNLSSQMLSKQDIRLAKQQLGTLRDMKAADLESILSIPNPSIKKKLLRTYADEMDSEAVDLQAAALPRTANRVLLPIPSLKDNEVYSPSHRNGETVVLIRHPHGGKFEIPELVVNNRNAEANRLIKNAADAVGVNPKVAHQLSGADFDGDTVLVIPNNNPKSKIQTERPLDQLKNFDARSQYYIEPTVKDGEKVYPYPTLKKASIGREMGDISNLITDMTIKGATRDELARAVKHSMVVIDAHKHNLNYKQSAIDNRIKDLKIKYQIDETSSPRSKGAASTIISRASSDVRGIPDRQPRSARDGGPWDPETGEKKWEETGKVNYRTGKPKTIKSPKMYETEDAHTLVSSPGKPIERVYADHANAIKALANRARVEYSKTPNIRYDPNAKQIYSKEVKSLDAKLALAMQKKPGERMAQRSAAAIMKAKAQANPGWDPKTYKKVQSQVLREARERFGDPKFTNIVINDDEWKAIQSGAVSANKLDKILSMTDLESVKERSLPRDKPAVSPALLARARSMVGLGYTQAEIADLLGISTSTLNKALKG